MGRAKNDWFAIAHPTDADATYVAGFWLYNNCTKTVGATGIASNSCSFTLPGTAGTYELRLFANGTSTRIATSALITLS